MGRGHAGPRLPRWGLRLQGRELPVCDPRLERPWRPVEDPRLSPLLFAVGSLSHRAIDRSRPRPRSAGPGSPSSEESQPDHQASREWPPSGACKGRQPAAGAPGHTRKNVQDRKPKKWWSSTRANRRGLFTPRMISESIAAGMRMRGARRTMEPVCWIRARWRCVTGTALKATPAQRVNGGPDRTRLERFWRQCFWSPQPQSSAPNLPVSGSYQRQ